MAARQTSSRHGSPAHSAEISASQGLRYGLVPAPQATVSSAVSEPTAASPSAPSKPARVRAMTMKRREQCRVNQARYRSKLKQWSSDLEVATQRLRMDIFALEDRRRTLCNAIDTRESSVRVIMEYFRLFRHGFRVSDSPDTQIAFVMARFDPNVRVDDVVGCEAFLEQTRRFTLFYDDVCTDLIRCSDWSKAERHTTVTTTLHTKLTVSSTTIREVFPHLLRPEHHHLRLKLLGQQLNIDAWGRFVLDETGTVLAYDWGMDFIAVLQKILTLEETAIVLGQAQIVREGNLVDTGADVERLCAV